MAPYHHRCSELSVADGCILWGSRVIVPSTGRQIVLDQLHECHLGISRMKSLARCYVWWPKIENDIEHLVQNCHTCQLHRPTPPKVPLHTWEYPQRPWSRIHIDHAGLFMGHTLLIIVDAYSKWIEAFIVPSTSTETTVKILRSLFATHGLPEHLVSDNGSGFTSQQFKQFMADNGIKHSCTSPYHPSSNGLAERAVQTVKQGISKLEGTIQFRLSRFLLTYRITPQTSTGLAPSELLMGRRLRTRHDQLHPDTTQRVLQKQETTPISKKVKKFSTIQFRLSRFLLTYRITPQTSTGLAPSELLMGRRLCTRHDQLHPDTTQRVLQRVLQKQETTPISKKVKKFSVGDLAYARNYTGGEKWIPVTITKITGPVSYVVSLNNGTTMRRHLDQHQKRYNAQMMDTSNSASTITSPDFEDYGPTFAPTQTEIHAPIQPSLQSNVPVVPTLRRSTRQ